MAVEEPSYFTERKKQTIQCFSKYDKIKAAIFFTQKNQNY